ncbi:GNAT family N-acetyltransferase [Humibacter sp. RRB41]|uniref:GNAT family N-acetyltransferase n=1 Tax=Humibacter sp. RRB41 TaxID=2919946 RepID=UPI001FA9F874|nr:GNAT family protein [Humibacter sp. RRB41]
MTTDVLLTILFVMVSVLLLLAFILAAGSAVFVWRRFRGRSHPLAGAVSTPWEFPTISGERLTLDLPVPSDFEAFYAMESDPRLFRYELEEPISREVAAERLKQSMAATRFEKPGDFVNPVIRDSSGNFLGMIYLKLQGAAADRSAEVGITLTRAAQGQGYPFEAGQLLLDIAFAKFHLHRVYAELDMRNVASRRICEHLGMRREAQFVEHRWIRGRWIDTGCYAILEREWKLAYLS